MIISIQIVASLMIVTYDCNSFIIQATGFIGQGSINKNPTVRLDGARPPPKSNFTNNMSLIREY